MATTIANLENAKLTGKAKYQEAKKRIGAAWNKPRTKAMLKAAWLSMSEEQKAELKAANPEGYANMVALLEG